MLILNPEKFRKNIRADVAGHLVSYVSKDLLSLQAYDNVCRVATNYYASTLKPQVYARLVTELTYKNIRNHEQYVYKASDYTTHNPEGLVLDVSFVSQCIFVELEKLRSGEREDAVGIIPNLRILVSEVHVLTLVADYVSSLNESEQIRQTIKASFVVLHQKAAEWERLKIKRLAKIHPAVTEGRTVLVRNSEITLDLLHSHEAFVAEGDFMNHCMNNPEHYSRSVLDDYSALNFHVRTGYEVATFEINLYTLAEHVNADYEDFSESLISAIFMASGYKNKEVSNTLHTLFAKHTTYEVIARAINIMFGVRHHFAPLENYELQAAYLFGKWHSLPNDSDMYRYADIATAEAARNKFQYAKKSITFRSLLDEREAYYPMEYIMRDFVLSTPDSQIRFGWTDVATITVHPKIWLPKPVDPKFEKAFMEGLDFVRKDWDTLDVTFKPDDFILVRSADNVLLNSLRKVQNVQAKWERLTSGLFVPKSETPKPTIYTSQLESDANLTVPVTITMHTVSSESLKTLMDNIAQNMADALGIPRHLLTQERP